MIPITAKVFLLLFFILGVKSDAPNCPAIDGDTPTYFPHEDCTKFYECFRGTAWELSCPAGLYFNPTLLVCDTPEHAGCKGNATAPSKVRHAVANVEQAPKCPAIDGETPTYFPHEDCTKFYECFRGIAWELSCPAGLYFNPTLLVCDTPEHAGCKGNPAAPSKVQHSVSNLEEAPECSAIDGDTPTYFPHEDCTKFYECFGGIAWELTCPPGLYFNLTLLVCDTPEHAGCKGNATAPSEVRHAVANLEQAPKCPAIDGETPTYFPHEDCTKFYECFRGIAWELSCPAGLYFNPTLLVCDRPEHAGCKGNAEAPSKVQHSVTNLEQAPKCPAIDGETPTYFPHEDCTKFYECFRGIAWELSCPAGLYFNPTLLVCDTPEHAGCKGNAETPSKVQHSVTNLKQAPKCPAIDGETPTYFPHEDCTKFYECFRGIAWELSCPAGLYFNPTLLVCDTPEHAGCNGNTSTPLKKHKT